jgi:hypothetical protein
MLLRGCGGRRSSSAEGFPFASIRCKWTRRRGFMERKRRLYNCRLCHRISSCPLHRAEVYVSSKDRLPQSTRANTASPCSLGEGGRRGAGQMCDPITRCVRCVARGLSFERCGVQILPSASRNSFLYLPLVPSLSLFPLSLGSPSRQPAPSRPRPPVVPQV